ncbi:RICIN domain-containing protein [Kitasatospora sp. NPDC018058]|uniref:RICIN domain-containing protein n=1 Tax=Kitasatospora sp. NPDC018058 TaxID=3364025 RepID=UPI0037BFE648
MLKLRKTRAKIVALILGLPALVLGTGAATASAADGYSWVQNANSGKCLAVGAASTNNGASVIQWDCVSGASEQYWSFMTLPSKIVNGIEYFHIINQHSTAANGTPMCLAVPGGTTAWNTQLMQWPCGDWNDHWWSLIGTSTGGWELRNLNGLCAAVGAGSTVSGAPVIQWGCDAGPEQSWHRV